MKRNFLTRYAAIILCITNYKINDVKNKYKQQNVWMNERMMFIRRKPTFAPSAQSNTHIFHCINDRTNRLQFWYLSSGNKTDDLSVFWVKGQIILILSIVLVIEPTGYNFDIYLPATRRTTYRFSEWKGQSLSTHTFHCFGDSTNRLLFWCLSSGNKTYDLSTFWVESWKPHSYFPLCWW